MTNEIQKKERDSNLELYRIIVMLLIVAHHYVAHSGLLDECGNDPLSAKSLFFYVFGMWGRTGIDCFVLITGYFMCKSKITLRKFLKLFLELEFYKIAIFSVFCLSGYHVFSAKELFRSMFFMGTVSGTFINCFLWFYLCIPFLTVLVTNLNKRQHALLLLLCLSVYMVLGTIPCFEIVMNHVSWYCVLFFIASYIRFYSFLPHFSARRWGGASAALVLLYAAVVIATAYANSRLGTHLSVWGSCDVNKIPAVATSVSLFMFFNNVKIKRRKWINTIAASTFGVLCIHDNSSAMWHWLWQDVVDGTSAFHRADAILYSVASVIAVFSVCALIDYIRIHTIEKWTFVWIDKFLAKHKINLW